MDKSKLKRAFSGPLSDAGFVRKGQTWFLEGEDSVAVVGLQKSNYSDAYYVNVALWLNELGEQKFPKEHLCHIRWRARSAWPDIANDIDALFDLTEQRYEDEEWCSKISTFVEDNIVPFFSQLLTLKDIKARYKVGGFSKAFVRRLALETLEDS